MDIKGTFSSNKTAKFDNAQNLTRPHRSVKHICLLGSLLKINHTLLAQRQNQSISRKTPTNRQGPHIAAQEQLSEPCCLIRNSSIEEWKWQLPTDGFVCKLCLKSTDNVIFLSNLLENYRQEIEFSELCLKSTDEEQQSAAIECTRQIPKGKTHNFDATICRIKLFQDTEDRTESLCKGKGNLLWLNQKNRMQTWRERRTKV